MATSSLRQFQLNGVSDTGRTVGNGSYATVKELEFCGLKCVGKKIHQLLFNVAQPQEKAAMLQRFAEECELLSRVHHPCVVQFLGIYLEQGSQLPVLVMEHLHTTLSDCLDRYGVLPETISYGILHDVALGLCYLHQHSPPIVHRDLSANNVLLTSSMNAKISDLGVAKILNITPAEMTHGVSTQAPGTPCYMPPEALMARPTYTSKIDSYSYGVLVIHTLCGRWPFPADAFRPDPHNPDALIPVSEVDRRSEYLQDISQDHPLMGLIHQCLSNTPARRPEALEIVCYISSSVMSRLPETHQNEIEKLQYWEGRFQSQQSQIDSLTAQNLQKQSEIEYLRIQLQEKQSQIDSIMADKQSEVEALRAEVERLSLIRQPPQSPPPRLKLKPSSRSQSIPRLERQLDESRDFSQPPPQPPPPPPSPPKVKPKPSSRPKSMPGLERQLDESKDFSQPPPQPPPSPPSPPKVKPKPTFRSQSLERPLGQSSDSRRSLTLPPPQVESRPRIQSDPSADSQSQPNLLHHQPKLYWKKTANLPVRMARPQVVAVGDKAYVGGRRNDSHVFQYDPLRNRWTTLPACPLRDFGLGQFSGELLTVGGVARDIISRKVHRYRPKSQTWEQFLKPMPSPRYGLSVLSTQSALIACGGITGTSNGTKVTCTTVEVYTRETTYWHTCAADPLPIDAPASMSCTTVANTAYLLGGVATHKLTRTVLYAPIASLIERARSRPQQSASDIRSAWKKLRDTPLRVSAAVSLEGRLMAIGGVDEHNKPSSAIYVYSPIKRSWTRVETGDLPEPRSGCTAVEMASGLLVVGGSGANEQQMNTVWMSFPHPVGVTV